jgi:para-nitrobenzyl esterase
MRQRMHVRPRTRTLHARSWVLLAVLLPACGDSHAPASLSDAGEPERDAAAQPTPDASAGVDGGGDREVSDVLTIDTGTLHGVDTGATYTFRGVPYAGPTAGEGRWRPPAAPPSWDGERDASAFGPPCKQVDALGSGQVIGSEDCLTLNVWTPKDQAQAPLPVMFWIHGGDNITGSSSDPLYDGAYLAEHARAVVVTINYRLAAFGWLAHPAFATENEHGSTGNYGLLDQIAALQWVQRNIAVFGGDPERVMVFGQSAGASNACALIASPLATGLFSRAVMHSLDCYIVDPSVVASTNQDTETALGCSSAADVAACLRAASADQVAAVPGSGLTGDGNSDFYEVLDGWALPEDPVSAIRGGRHNPMPMMMGTTSDEYSQLEEIILTDPRPTDHEYEELIRSWYPDDPAVADQVLAVYSLDEYGSGHDALVAILSDTVMTCPTRAAARAAVAGQTQAVYRYLFTHPYDNAPQLDRYGAAHGFDIPFVFHDFETIAPSPDELALADDMLGYWSRFAATGDPNDGQAFTWPAYEAETDPLIELDHPLHTGAGWRNAECDFWESLEP